MTYSAKGVDSRAFDPSGDQDGQLSKINTYNYWKDRLLSIEIDFDESELATL